MILKQNCIIITDAEIKNVKNGYTDNRPMTYTGSSLQRKIKNPVVETLEQIKDRLNNAKPVVKKTEIIREYSLSNKSKTKLTNKIIAWSNLVPKSQQVKFTFCTLTLTSKQIGSDKEFTKMLNTFLTYLRKYYNLKHYLFVLERQTKSTNNLHAHIIFSQFLPIQNINRIWCKILSSNGYTYLQNGTITTPIQALKNKLINKSLTTPSPVDISHIYNIKAVSHYITKYITKNDVTINTNIWNCSNSISRLWIGANICAKKYYDQLKSFIITSYKIKVSDSLTFNIHLLKHYTQLQKSIFKEINQNILC